ncbi:MAG: carbohydrate-binding family 9-like protein [Prolixibacteraceae bacterium]|jgi:hypothetical protein|nr:hypothetical protein [Prolixibacteraceae bacterium]MDI9564502.1 carbohydrate-binding family 9-like protein [Bacteroidota bacterium]NLS98954.1 hypothetical protein [Bacteroidales bacterium]OQB79791.1 MAG: hypothetical protein BWX87_01937 [Bacteroidetes bacterium ADurb.Bin123]HNU76735.1 carbohydrate-binding family 9-like protein [Prolixibacteraceae bacterium]
MKSLEVILMETVGPVTLNSASLLLENLVEMHRVDCINWKEFSGKPAVDFRIGHTADHLLLKFYVREDFLRAMETEINGDVYQDSCVEFFLAIDGRHYYNFEFNCIGTPHVAWGEGRHNRQHLPPEVVRTIGVKSSLGKEPFGVRTGPFSWNLVVLIPASVLVHDPGISFAGLSATANFYKCGDKLPEPHFVTWNPVGTPQPDFHRPEFFGKIDFE